LPTGSIAVTQAAGNNTTAPATTAFVQGALAPALHDVGRNKWFNPLFNIWQRGLGPYTANGYTADSYWSGRAGSDTLSIAHVSLTDAQRASIGDEEATDAYQCTATGSAVTGSQSIFGQGVEGVARLSNKTITVSFWAWVASGTLKVGVSADQYGGSTGFAYLNGVGQSVTVTTTPTRYAVTLNVPSIAGKTVSGADDYTWVNIWLSGAADANTDSGSVGVQSGTFTFWGMQVEVGNIASPLEKPSRQQDWANVQRYYQRMLQTSMISVPSSSGGIFGQTLPFIVTMKAAPAVTLANPVTSNCTALTAANIGINSLFVYATAAANAGAQWGADILLDSGI
jgi:hypothetical protein